MQKIEYNKLDQGDFAYYDMSNPPDCDVDTLDLSALASANGSSVGGGNYNPLYDLDSNGTINNADQNLLTPKIGTTCPRFIYDAGGELTKLEGPKQMVYIGGVFEKDPVSGEITKYYSTADGRRIAMRKGAGLYYFANDHLGGTAIVMESADLLVTRTRYYPYGSV